MPDASTLALFVVAALALLAVPGPAVLYVVARSVDQGRVAGLVSVLGIHTGSLVHVAAAALGISSLVVSSAVAFSVVKYAGAAYLILLGVRALLARGGDVERVANASAAPLRRLYAQAIVVNVLNPKTALFFFAFLPQFVEPDGGAVALQLAVLGLVFIALGIVSDGAYAVLAGSLGHLVRGNRRVASLRRRLSGAVFIGLGIATAASGSRHRTA